MSSPSLPSLDDVADALDSDAVARVLHCSRRHAERVIGSLPHVLLGRRRVVLAADLARYVAQRVVLPTPEAEAEANAE